MIDFAPPSAKPLLVAHVVSFAKKNCKDCRGSGYVVRIHFAGAKGEQRTPDACRCALRKFNKKHKADVVVTPGGVFWKPGLEPSA